MEKSCWSEPEPSSSWGHLASLHYFFLTSKPDSLAMHLGAVFEMDSQCIEKSSIERTEVFWNKVPA